MFLKYEYNMFSAAYDVIPFVALFILHSCCFGYKVTFNELPPFIPNDYLFTQYAKKIQKPEEKPLEKWEVYAETIREVLVKVGDSKKDETNYRDKTAYEIELGYKKERATK